MTHLKKIRTLLKARSQNLRIHFGVYIKDCILKAIHFSRFTKTWKITIDFNKPLGSEWPPWSIRATNRLDINKTIEIPIAETGLKPEKPEHKHSCLLRKNKQTQKSTRQKFKKLSKDPKCQLGKTKDEITDHKLSGYKFLACNCVHPKALVNQQKSDIARSEWKHKMSIDVTPERSRWNRSKILLWNKNKSRNSCRRVDIVATNNSNRITVTLDVLYQMEKNIKPKEGREKRKIEWIPGSLLRNPNLEM